MAYNLPVYVHLSSVFIQFTILLQCTLFTNASVLHFQSLPDVVIEGLTKSVSLNCSVSDSAVSGSIVGKRDVTHTQDNISAVTSLVVTLEGKDVAMVSLTTPAQVVDGSTNVQVSGGLSGNSGSGFIQLTITDPTVDQTGEFVCEGSGVSTTGHGVKLSSAIEVTNSEASITDLVAFVRDLSKENGDLKKTVALMSSKMNALEVENGGLKQAVSELKNKTELMVYFNARINNTPHLSAGQVAVFGLVEESKGHGYNKADGLFTCEIPGYYHFTLGCLSMPDKRMNLILLHNSHAIFHVYGVAGHSHQGNANAATLQLATGDVVKIQAQQDSDIDGPYCSFHGYLINAL